MTVFDGLVILILLLSVGLAVVRGALLELGTLVVLGIAWLAAVQFAPALIGASGKESSLVTVLGAYALLMGLVFIVLYTACHILLGRANLSGRAQLVNRIAGGVFGFLRGYAVIGLGFLAYGYYLDEDSQHESVRKAMTRPLAASGAQFFQQFIPPSTQFEPEGTDGVTSSNTGATKSNTTDAASDGYARRDRAGFSEVITTVTTSDGDIVRPQTEDPGRD
ncbi:MAG: CvpA family protein [Pseudomonadota bacterium]